MPNPHNLIPHTVFLYTSCNQFLFLTIHFTTPIILTPDSHLSIVFPSILHSSTNPHHTLLFSVHFLYQFLPITHNLTTPIIPAPNFHLSIVPGIPHTSIHTLSHHQKKDRALRQEYPVLFFYRSNMGQI